MRLATLLAALSTKSTLYSSYLDSEDFTEPSNWPEVVRSSQNDLNSQKMSSLHRLNVYLDVICT